LTLLNAMKSSPQKRNSNVKSCVIKKVSAILSCWLSCMSWNYAQGIEEDAK